MSATDGAPVGELGAELRALADVLLDRLEPWLQTLAAPAEDDDGPGSAPGAVATTCAWCPVCALVAAVRGERPELGRRLAEQGTGALAALRLLLDEHGAHPHPSGPAGTTPDAPAPSRVQPITVRRR